MPDWDNAQKTTGGIYDRLSSWYDWLTASEDVAIRRVVKLLALMPGERVIEIGCGTGKALVGLAHQVGMGGLVLGMDISAGMLAQAVRRIRQGKKTEKVSICRGDALGLPFVGNQFNVALMTFTLELFPAREMPGLLEECRRVLRPAGRIGVVSLRASQDPGWMERIYGWAHERYPRWIDCRPIRGREIVEAMGFAIVRQEIDIMWGLPVEILVGCAL